MLEMRRKAASVVVGTQTLKRYLKVLMKGFKLNEIPGDAPRTCASMGT